MALWPCRCVAAVLWLVSATLLSACVTQPAGPPASLALERPVRSIAVVSAIGDSIAIKKYGVISLDEAFTEPVDWQLDQVASAAAASVIRAQRPALALASLDYQPAALARDLYRVAAFQPYADPARIDTALRGMIAGKDVDLIFLITRDRQSGGPMPYSDVGIATMPSSWREMQPVSPVAVLRLFVLEAATLRVLSSAGRTAEGKLYNYNPLVSSQPLGGPAPFKAGFRPPLTAEQRHFLRPLLEDLVAEAVSGLVNRNLP